LEKVKTVRAGRRGVLWAFAAGYRMDSIGIYIGALVLFALGAAVAAGYFLTMSQGGGDTPRFFAQRSRRLAFIERTALDGGRKLLLVRRDDVEHLILIGGPIDLVVETGIRAELIAGALAREDGLVGPVRDWPLPEAEPSLEAVTPLDARLPLGAKTGMQGSGLAVRLAEEVKAAE
jgi:hypothetical protein